MLNWSDLGGINAYCNTFGCSAITFYTNAAARTAYRAYIKFVVNRYKSSSAIFSWSGAISCVVTDAIAA